MQRHIVEENASFCKKKFNREEREEKKKSQKYLKFSNIFGISLFRALRGLFFLGFDLFGIGNRE
ncbi:MAG: hypothetical protein A2Y62_01525 [Candidatus Fischerbacteria bacterium RBG_13_37_8]|uniref:Uncharacterized protein n=1 Tax=Candidatus Fischerbacteria bacterium RBG_13_37_8 TaxID=1817863 RepID=A0A1F5VU98_9BACT|nr:MAG: hypothetical protein A2Y62_01525 [Candidatus Fischerbacteria bacterium RBG_13_37_8]